MTPTTLAETILRDVPRYSEKWSEPGLYPKSDGGWVGYHNVLAALTAALDPALSGRAVEVLEGVTPGPWWTEPEGTVRNDADGNPRYDLPRFVRYDKTGHTVCKTHLIGGVDPDPALANARFIAWCREGVPSLIARIAAMEAQIKGLEGGIEAACDREAETERKLRNALAASETRAEAAETALVAERAKTAKLVEALKVARAHVANNADGWSVSRGAARVDLTIVDAAITEASQ